MAALLLRMFSATVALAAASPYDGAMRGVRVVTVVESEANLTEAFRQRGAFTSWAEHGRFTAEVPPGSWQRVRSELIRGRGLRVTSLQPDLQAQIDAERAVRAAHPYPPPRGGVARRVDEFYEAFRDIDEVEAHLLDMVRGPPAIQRRAWEERVDGWTTWDGEWESSVSTQTRAAQRWPKRGGVRSIRPCAPRRWRALPPG
jgi:hypothetical protein